MYVQKKIYTFWSDEIYERICYNDEFVSVASLGEDAKNITITVNGFAKSVAMTGLRLGYTASNKIIAKGISFNPRSLSFSSMFNVHNIQDMEH